MSIRWLAVQNLQQGQDLLAAVNTLSIHTKLLLAGKPDEDRKVAAKDARQRIAAFLEQLEKVVGDRVDADEPVLGADPRMRALARSFIKARTNHRRFHSDLAKKRLGDIKQLLYANDPEKLESLVSCLADLRVILEEHLQADADKVLGRF